MITEELRQEQFRNRMQAEIEAEIERLARAHGVEPFNFDEAVNDLQDEWTEEDERVFEEWMAERKETRKAEREAQEKEWQS